MMTAQYEDIDRLRNTLNLRHPRVPQMVTDSLRYGSRRCTPTLCFDLATALAREDNR